MAHISPYSSLPHTPPHLPHVSPEMSVATDVSVWIATPAPLNRNKCGERAVFSGDNSIVQRRDPEQHWCGCVCYTAHPLPPGQVWQTTILETTTKWNLGLVSGCVPSILYTKTSKHSSTMTATVVTYCVVCEGSATCSNPVRFTGNLEILREIRKSLRNLEILVKSKSSVKSRNLHGNLGKFPDISKFLPAIAR